jgi:hypothetical protein
MIQIEPFSDERHDYYCAYCGDNAPNTRDHVPSRILLDDPFPENLPVVGCCEKCNNDFSKDEGYFAAGIECMIHATSNVELLSREKIKNFLNKNAELKNNIEASFFEEEQLPFLDIPRKLFFKRNPQRFENVITKLAKGHVKFELSKPITSHPDVLWFGFIEELSPNDRDAFLGMSLIGKVSEIGSRMSQRILIEESSGNGYNCWITVQEGRYAYHVTDLSGKVIVKMLLSDRFCCYVEWKDWETISDAIR